MKEIEVVEAEAAILSAKPATHSLSVVIATLGGESLARTIEQLNNSDIRPAEILVCIPDADSHRVVDLPGNNVRIIKTPRRGQVAQRAYGLQQATQPLVMQLDDDVTFHDHALARLMASLEHLGRGNAVAPLYRDPVNWQYITRFHHGVFGWMQSLYAFLVCGAPWGVRRMGVISPAGIGYGVDREHCGSELFETQWLPGACVLCHREDLVLEDYYPFAGKAYTEDLVHSILWRKRGVRLWVEPAAISSMPITVTPFSWRTIRNVVKAHRHVVGLIGGQKWRLRLWHVTHLSKSIFVLTRNELVLLMRHRSR